MEPTTPAVETLSFSHWTTKEVSALTFLGIHLLSSVSHCYSILIHHTTRMNFSLNVLVFLTNCTGVSLPTISRLAFNCISTGEIISAPDLLWHK